MNRTSTPRAFTLIELLVVIAIIGLLSSVVLASLNTARAKARDAQRASDLRQVVNALELYANDHSATYPVPANPGTGCGGARHGTCLGDSTMANALVPQYLPAMPHDPLYEDKSTDYLYVIEPTYHSRYIMLRRSETKNSWCVPPSSSLYANGWETTYPKC